MLKRGVWELKGERVGMRPLSTLTPASESELPADTEHPRTQLARWLTAPEHPLVARVLINRIWQRTFGAGLVRTPENFGLQGEQPTHPDLLDWLAVELQDSGWNMKHMLRLMVTSRTFRQCDVKSIERH